VNFKFKFGGIKLCLVRSLTPADELWTTVMVTLDQNAVGGRWVW